MIKPGEVPTGEQIKKAREKAELSFEAAAALIYKKRRVWIYYESGKRTMDPAYWELWQYKAAMLKLESTNA